MSQHKATSNSCNIGMSTSDLPDMYMHNRRPEDTYTQLSEKSLVPGMKYILACTYDDTYMQVRISLVKPTLLKNKRLWLLSLTRVDIMQDIMSVSISISSMISGTKHTKCFKQEGGILGNCRFLST